jgi:hypothetical protein
MIIGWIELTVFGFLFLSVVYVLVSIYSRSVRREKLEKRWDDEEMEGDRDAFIAEGMAHYEQGLRKKLIVLIYIIPAVLVPGMIYFLNFK